MCPGGVFVIDGAVLEASVEDTDETIAEDAECLVVEIAFGAPLVVEHSGSFAAADRAERPLVDGVIETSVLDVAG